MNLLRCVLFCCLTLAISVAWAQGRTIPAIKVPLPIKIDGDLNDKVWETLPSISNFITSFPNYGKVSLFKTEVKIAYDDNAVYVAAHTYMISPKIYADNLLLGIILIAKM